MYWWAGQQDATRMTDAARVGSLETNIIWYFRQRKQKTGLINIIKRIIVISLERSFVQAHDLADVDVEYIPNRFHEELIFHQGVSRYYK